MRARSVAASLLGLALAAAACAPEAVVSQAPVVALPPPTSASPVPAASAPGAKEPVASLPGVDTSSLDGRELAEWSALVGDLAAPCPSVAVPVARCVSEKRDCPRCAVAASWVARAVHQGSSSADVRAAYRARFDPATAVTIDVSGSPSRGPESAPVTLVEFVDLECPHCRIGVAKVDAILAANPGAVRVVYKAFPLSSHPHAVDAARAAVAADRQAEFWEMMHLLLDHQDRLEARDLEGYARQLKLDVARWRADMKSAAVAARVDEDRRTGDALHLHGTPTFYVNGRELGDGESLEDRVKEEIGEVREGATRDGQ